MTSTVDTGDIKVRAFETARLASLASDHVVAIDGAVSGPGNAAADVLLQAGMARMSTSVSPVSIDAQVVIEDLGRIAKYTLLDAVGRENTWYLGPFPVAPLITTSGLPVTPGNLYFNTTDLQMYVYTGAEIGWQLSAQVVPANLKTYVWYCTFPQAEFPSPDNPRDTLGQVLAFELQHADDVAVFVNGAKLVNGADYVLQPNTSVKLGMEVCANSVVEVRVSKRIELNYEVVATLVSTNTWVIDGVQTRFPLYDTGGRRLTAASSTNCLVVVNGSVLNPVEAYYVLNGDVIFTEPPDPDGLLWMQVGLPITQGIYDNAIEIGGGGILEVQVGEPLLFYGLSPDLPVADTTPTQLPIGLVPVDAAPTPSAATHGKFCLLSRDGFNDQLLVCVRNASNLYYWQPLIYMAAA